MRVSHRTKYGVAAMTYLAAQYESGRAVPLNEIAGILSVSKVYMEQIFCMLRASGCLSAAKGPCGGYRLSRSPEQIAAYDFLRCLEPSLFEPPQLALGDSARPLEQGMTRALFGPLEAAMAGCLQAVTLSQLTAPESPP